MIDPISQRHNRQNLLLTSEVLKDLNPFPFFGTLLGLTREGDIIDGDDDIDLYIEMSHRENVMARLRAAGFECTDQYPNNTPFFLQAKRFMDGLPTYVDVYLYEDKSSNNWVIDRWNFAASPSIDKSHLHVPKDVVFPLVRSAYSGQDIFMPRRAEDCCVFLYGDKWSEKLSKADGEYTVAVVDHRPVIVRQTEIAFAFLEEKRAGDVAIHDLKNAIASLTSEHDVVIAERDILAAERTSLAAERDVLLQQQEDLKEQFARLEAEQAEAARQLHDALAGARDIANDAAHLRALLTDARTERDVLLSLSNAASAECSRLRRCVDDAVTEKDAALGRMYAASIASQTSRIWLGRSRADVRARQTALEELAALGFDPDAYRNAYADVAASGMDPRQHYAMFGQAEGRRAWFRPELALKPAT